MGCPNECDPNWILKKRQWRRTGEIWGENFIDIYFLPWIIVLICCLGYNQSLWFFSKAMLPNV